MRGKFKDNVYACFLVISDEYENFQLCSPSNLLIFTTHLTDISVGCPENFSLANSEEMLEF